MSRGPAMSEEQLDHHVRVICAHIEKMRPGALLAYHTHDSRRSAAGFPDWTFATARGVMFRELKTDRGKVTADQQAWLAMLRGAGYDADVWRPADLEAGRIVWQLGRLSGLMADIYLTGKPSAAEQCAIDHIMEDE